MTKEKTDVKITNINKIAKYIRVINRNNQQDVMVISELQIDYEKLANYDEVNNAIEAANKLNRDLYDNFSKVDEVIKAVVKNLESSKQDVVDGYAEAIYKAISELKLKLAYYSKVDSAIEKAKALNEDNYKDFSKVKDAINKVVYDLDITKQEEVNEMAKAIEDAIKALEKNEVGNKGKLQEVINKKPLKDEQAYTKASWKAYEEALEKATQKEIDDATKALQDAYAKLKENPDLTPIGPSEQVIPMTPLKLSTPVDSTETEKPSTTDKVENGEKPSTGVSTNTNLLWIIVFVGSIVVLVSTKKYLDKN